MVNRKLVGPQSRSGCLGEEKISFHLSEFEPQNVQCLAGRCFDYAFLAPRTVLVIGTNLCSDYSYIAVVSIWCQKKLQSLIRGFFPCGAAAELVPRPPQLLRFLDHTHTHTYTHTHTQYDCSERLIGSSQRPLPTQHTRNTRISMLLVAFEPAIPVIKLLQSHSFDGAPSGIGVSHNIVTGLVI